MVFDEFEGQGLAGQLVTGALDDVRAQGKKVIATCPYVKRFIEKHAEYADLLVVSAASRTTPQDSLAEAPRC